MMIGKFETQGTETDVQENDQNKEENSRFESVLDDDEIEYLDKNTADNSEGSSPVNIADYTDDELRELYDDFAGYTNGDVRYENNGKNIEDATLPREYSDEYKQTGIHRVSWSKDSIDGSEQEIILPVGTKIIQYAHEGTSGRYFASEGTDYSNLQLADSQDKRVLSTYEVVKELPINESIIAKQYFSNSEGSGTTRQFKSELTTDELVEQGALIKVEKSPGEKL